MAKDKDQDKLAPIEPEVLRAARFETLNLDDRLADREAELVELFLYETDPHIEKEMISGKKIRFIDKKAGNETMALVAKIVSYRTILAERKTGEPPGGNADEEIHREMDEAEIRVSTRLKSIKGGRR